MARYVVTFNSADLTTVTGLTVIDVNAYRVGNRELTTSKLANTDKSVTSSAFYKDKKINVSVQIGRNTRELLEDSLDALYALLQTVEAALVVSFGSSTRQWTATVSNIAYSDMTGGMANLDIEFECADPIGKETGTTQLFSTALTGASSTTNFVVAGTALWQQPQITITISALTGGTAKVVTVGNSVTGQQVSITRTWTAGNVLVVDSINKKVTVNGTEVAFTGAIPEWAPGAGSMDYSDTLTTRTRTMTAVYYKRRV